MKKIPGERTKKLSTFFQEKSRLEEAVEASLHYSGSNAALP